MTKQQENKAFAKMLKEFPKAFGRVSFRERLMLRTAFTYVIEEVIGDIKANYELAIEGRDVRIIELEKEYACLKSRYDRVDIIGYDALKNFVKAKDIIRALLFHITDDTFYVTCETKKQSVERARQFLREGVKESGLQKENEQLKQQIEKMKCCENCKHKKSEVDRCELLMYSLNACLCKNKDKWEAKND